MVLLPVRPSMRYYSCETDLLEKLRNYGHNNGNVYFNCDGKYVTEEDIEQFLLSNIGKHYIIEVKCRLRGGKGGFGSLLRSFRVNKSTNQLMCRDLNGRRLASIDEEKKLRQWVEKAADRERAKDAKKRAKLEKLRNPTSKHEFEDNDYRKVSEDILEKVDDAVDKGFDEFRKIRDAKKNATPSSESDSDLEFTDFGGRKRKPKTTKVEPKEKKTKMAVDSESSDDSEDEVDPSLIGELAEYFKQKDNDDDEEASISQEKVGVSNSEESSSSTASI